jgi:hypothetical protein
MKFARVNIAEKRLQPILVVTPDSPDPIEGALREMTLKTSAGRADHTKVKVSG